MVHLVLLDGQKLDGVVLLRQNQCVAQCVTQHRQFRSHGHLTSFQGRFLDGADGDHGDFAVCLLDQRLLSLLSHLGRACFDRANFG